VSSQKSACDRTEFFIFARVRAKHSHPYPVQNMDTCKKKLLVIVGECRRVKDADHQQEDPRQKGNPFVSYKMSAECVGHLLIA